MSSNSNDTVVDLFDAIVERYPDRPAIQDESGSKSYSELAALVRAIASVTTAAASGRPGPIAILLRHELRFPAALLGVLAAGRGYIPLDADHPIDRNSRIAAHAGAAAILSAGDAAATAAALFGTSLPVVDLDFLDRLEQAQPETRPLPQDLAWITYTSGSTGAPKGVYQDRSGLLRDLMESTETTGLTHEDRVAMFSSPSLLHGTRISLSAFTNGASVHVLRPRELTGPGIAREIRSREITVFRSVPALFARVAESLGEGEKLDTLRLVYLGGDRVGWNDFDLFRRTCSPLARFGTHLGSTECSTVYLHWLVSDELRDPGRPLPVGRPLPGRQVRLLDRDGRDVDDGEVGEFVVTSRFLARGYWRDAELTASSFAIDPSDPMIRTFRSGDLGRRRPDGLFEFVGRKDAQIKLSGFRVEPGEIEGALRACSGVRDAAIVVRRNSAGIARSAVGYVELSKGVEGLQPRHIVAMVAQVLPRHMVPASVFIEAELPRLVNLKLDRGRLAALDLQRAQANATDHAGDLWTLEVIRVFETALGISGASTDDNLSSLGADSLQAVTVLAALERRFELSIPDDIFEGAESIDELAAWIKAHATVDRA
jgi:amino acid adenylation domain-containing protein